jgi:hypothetical protein
MRAELELVEAGFGKLPDLAGNGSKLVAINSGGTAMETITSLTVAQGGTGRVTGTSAYALVATGTSATAAQQSLAVGATTEILVGGGNAALPVWTAATGSGAPVRADSPTLVTPALGIPSSGTLTNCTGLVPATGLSSVTGTGVAVLATSPTLVTPTLGVATASSLNKITFTQPATGATVTITDGKTLSVSNTLTLAGTDSTTMTFPVESASVGFRNIPQQSKSTAYTTVLGDSGKHLYHPTSDNNARTFTIDSNANVAYPIGTAITFVNMINTITIAITSDTMYFAGTAGTTGSRTLAAYGTATALKVDTTTWIISGIGLS